MRSGDPEADLHIDLNDMTDCRNLAPSSSVFVPRSDEYDDRYLYLEIFHETPRRATAIGGRVLDIRPRCHYVILHGRKSMPIYMAQLMLSLEFCSVTGCH